MYYYQRPNSDISLKQKNDLKFSIKLESDFYTFEYAKSQSKASSKPNIRPSMYCINIPDEKLDDTKKNICLSFGFLESQFCRRKLVLRTRKQKNVMSLYLIQESEHLRGCSETSRLLEWKGSQMTSNSHAYYCV